MWQIATLLDSADFRNVFLQFYQSWFRLLSKNLRHRGICYFTQESTENHGDKNPMLPSVEAETVCLFSLGFSNTLQPEIPRPLDFFIRHIKVRQLQSQQTNPGTSVLWQQCTSAAGSWLKCRFPGPTSVEFCCWGWWWRPSIHVLIKYLDDSNAGSLALRNSATEAEVHIYLQAS